MSLEKWRIFKEEFKEADLLIGNGFSINFSDMFRYNSLFKSFIDRTDNAELFRKFNSTNFELIMKWLKITNQVMGWMDISDKKVLDLYNEIKEGLIRVIIDNHPKHYDVDSELEKKVAYEMATQFGDVYTTNYDNLLYHLILKANDLKKDGKIEKGYSDYFYEPNGNDWLAFTGVQNYPYKKIFYLHGALCLYEVIQGDAWKIRKTNQLSDLLQVIVGKVRENQIPVFVSEGDTKDKQKSINSNRYLTFCLDHLRESDSNKMFIYGFSFSDQDAHIIEALSKNKTYRYGVALFIGSKTENELDSEMNLIRSKLPRTSVTFFDSKDVFPFKLSSSQ